MNRDNSQEVGNKGASNLKQRIQKASGIKTEIFIDF